MSATAGAVETVDLASTPLREVNQRLHDQAKAAEPIRHWQILNPSGAHALACGLDAPIEVEIMGHAGYYCAGMNKLARVRVTGNAGQGLAENMMSGRVTVDGNASQAAGATAHGGLIHIRGDASARCGISLKGASILVEGLKKGKRHHVHLSKDVDTARKVGARRGPPVILQVDAGNMYGQGFRFFRSVNGVWLTECVPAAFLTTL